MASGRLAMALLGGLVARVSAASPSANVDDDAAAYDALYTDRALPPFTGGILPLTEARVRSLMRDAAGPGAGPEAGPGAGHAGLWFAPVRSLRLSLWAASVHARPYSTPARPRDIAGSIDLSCEHRAGEPCGDGVGASLVLDSTAGFEDLAAAAIRLRASSGTDAYGDTVAVDRAYGSLELDRVFLEAGRDVLSIGPSRRTSLAWSDSAIPLDQVRISTARPLDLAGDHGDVLRGSVFYLIGRLRGPQTYPHSLVTIARAQADIANNVELAMGQLLMLGGDGAPSLGPLEFVLEHLRRGDKSAGPTDSSNRRIMFDVAFRIAAFHDARFYYQVVFEDWRKDFLDALRFDADHLAGIEIDNLRGRGNGALVIELTSTGVRSEEHMPRVTGFTNGGRIVGFPLGPDATSLYVGGRLCIRDTATVAPWLEAATLSSNTYTFVTYGPISLASRGPSELRFRGGATVRLRPRRAVGLEASAFAERVVREAFVPGADRDNAGLELSLVWEPR